MLPSRKTSTAGVMGCQEPKVQQGEAQDTMHLEKNNPRHQCTFGAPIWKEAFQKGPGTPGGHQVEYESAVCSCCKEGEWYSVLH